MYNPFTEYINRNDDDLVLIQETLQGNEGSLEKLILRHQAWVYNIAFKMVMDHDDACDITQEILIKVITRLATYDPEKAAFRTWLYRIAANYVLTMQTKKFERRIHDFDTYVNLIENLPDHRSFALAGVPAISIQSKEHTIHSAEDTSDKLVPETIASAARLAVEILGRLQDTWPG